MSTWGDKFLPWGDKNVVNNDGNPTKTYEIYVCGAVKNEGYCEVAEGGTYFDAIVKAGRLECSWLSPSIYLVVDERQLSIVVPYIENGEPHESYDANSIFFSLRDVNYFDGLSEAVVNKIADYLETHGKIVNKNVLYEVLGNEDYTNYHYKLYIAEADYEEVH